MGVFDTTKKQISSLVGLTSLGRKAAAAALGTVWSDEDLAAVGATNETAPASDTATAGLNGRLQRIAQRLTSLIGLLPTSLGQKTMANGLAVTIASDQSVIPASQSGTWNVTNISGTVSLPTGAATAAKQPALGTAGTPSSDVITVQGITSGTPLTTSQARSATGTDGAAIAVSTSITPIVAAVSTRKKVTIAHNGGARIWLGSDNAVTAGMTGNNFGYIDSGDAWDEAFYTGGVWGRTEGGTGYAAPLEV